MEFNNFQISGTQGGDSFSRGSSDGESSPKIEIGGTTVNTTTTEQGSNSAGSLHYGYMSEDRGELGAITVRETGTKTGLVSGISHIDRGGQLAYSIHQPTGSFPFLKMPEELRNMVYEDLLTLRMNPVCDSRNNPHGSAQTSILRTCQKIRDEASSLLYFKNELMLQFQGDFLNYGTQCIHVLVPSFDIYADRAQNSWRSWSQLPAYFYRCESFEIRLGINDYFLKYQPASVEEETLKTIANFNSVVYTLLLKHQSLGSIHFVLSITTETTPDRSIVSDQVMRSLERRCLGTLGRLQGLKKVKLEGFNFEDPVYIASVRRQMLKPRPQIWNALSADYQQSPTP